MSYPPVKYPDAENHRLVEMQDRLGRHLDSAEAAGAQFEALWKRLHADPEKLMAKAEGLLEAHGVPREDEAPARVEPAKAPTWADFDANGHYKTTGPAPAAAPAVDDVEQSVREAMQLGAAVMAAKTKAPKAEGVPEAKPAPAANRPPRFWIPDAVFDQGLSPQEFVVYAYLCRRAGKSRRCWPSVTTITKVGRVNRHTAIAVLDALEMRGMVTSRKRFGKTSVYTLTAPETWRRSVVPGEALLSSASNRTTEAVLQ